MDRRIIYVGALPQDLDVLKPQIFAQNAIGWLAQGVIGTDTIVDGLSCTPTSPASLSVNIAPGAIYQLEPVDQNAFGSIAADSHQIVKQGVNKDTQQFTLTPPAVAGQAQNFLVQAQIYEQDVETTVIPYFNAQSLTNPNAVAFSGPNNSGVAQPLTRTLTVGLSLKAGVAATAGTQTTPAPDIGYVGLYSITVAQGQTQITAESIVTIDNAPIIGLKLPQIPKWVQGGQYAWGDDTSAVANQIVVTLNPLPDAIGKGFGIRCKVANGVTGATTLLIKRGALASLGPYAVVKSVGTPLASGDIAANQVVDLVFDGTSFRDITGTTSTVSVGPLTASSGEGVNVDGGGVVSLNFPGLTAQSVADTDLFAFYSQADTHHRSLTKAQLAAALAPAATGLVNFQVFKSSGSYVKTPGARKALVFITGGGGAGAVSTVGAGGGAGETVIGLVDVSALSTVPVTIGEGGAGVLGNFTDGLPGGDSSFGAYLTAKGGFGGIGAGNGRLGGAGGSGGAVSVSSALSIPGGDGETAVTMSTYGEIQCGFSGGASFWGGGGKGWDAVTAPLSGWPGRAYGAGGGGASTLLFQRSGGNGAKGVIMVLEF